MPRSLIGDVCLPSSRFPRTPNFRWWRRTGEWSSCSLWCSPRFPFSSLLIELIFSSGRAAASKREQRQAFQKPIQSQTDLIKPVEREAPWLNWQSATKSTTVSLFRIICKEREGALLLVIIIVCLRFSESVLHWRSVKNICWTSLWKTYLENERTTHHSCQHL